MQPLFLVCLHIVDGGGLGQEQWLWLWSCCGLQDILNDGSEGTDASGNPILKDIGHYLKGELKKHFKVGDPASMPTLSVRTAASCFLDRLWRHTEFVKCCINAQM